MSKRFTETSKWDDVWFRKLPPKHKIFWVYLCDKCDISGVWKKDFELVEFFIGEKIDENECIKLFNESKERVSFLLGGDWVINEFIEFQYGELNENCRPHKSVMDLIKKREKKQSYKKNDCLIESKKPYKIPTDSIGKVVVGWKMILGVEKDDRSWDKLNWGRISKSASKLLDFFGDDIEKTINCMEDIYKELKAKNLECTIETVIKRADVWKIHEEKKNGFLEINSNKN